MLDGVLAFNYCHQQHDNFAKSLIILLLCNKYVTYSNGVWPTGAFLSHYLDPGGEQHNTEQVSLVQVSQYGAHGLLELFQLASKHWPADVQHKDDVFW